LSLEACFGLAESVLTDGEVEKGVELLSLVAHHDASSQDLKTKSQEMFQSLLEESQDRSLQEAWKRGVEMGIDDVGDISPN
jgi:hypothetical protein